MVSGQHFQAEQGMDQSGKIANPARGQLNRENVVFPVPVCAREFGLARQVRPSRPVSPCSFSTLRLNLVLTRGTTPTFRDSVRIYRQPPSGQSRVHRVTQIRSDGFYHREFAGTGSAVFKVVPVTGASNAYEYSGNPMNHFLCVPLFPHPLLLL